jgi:Integrase core domain
VAYVEVLRDEKGHTVAGFLRRAVAFYGSHGIHIERVMTDNGSGYRSIVHALACRTLGLRHLRTRPYRPRTNGKAERFIRTMLGGWAYGAIYGTSAERTRALPGWLDHYNRRRPHRSLNRQPPLTRLQQMRNNAPGSYNWMTSSGPATCARRARCRGWRAASRGGPAARDRAYAVLLGIDSECLVRTLPSPAGRSLPAMARSEAEWNDLLARRFGLLQERRRLVAEMDALGWLRPSYVAQISEVDEQIAQVAAHLAEA